MANLTRQEYVLCTRDGGIELTLVFPSIELATQAADHFQRLYYMAYDSDTRVDEVSKFYRPNSSISWNGNPYAGADGVRQLLIGMPKTKHDVLSFDCHPIPGLLGLT